MHATSRAGLGRVVLGCGGLWRERPGQGDGRDLRGEAMVRDWARNQGFFVDIRLEAELDRCRRLCEWASRGTRR